MDSSAALSHIHLINYALKLINFTFTYNFHSITTTLVHVNACFNLMPKFFFALHLTLYFSFYHPTCRIVPIKKSV